METTKFTTIDEYQATLPAELRKVAEEMRQTILKAAPHAKEVISYGMPAFKQHKVLVYYAVWKEHVGFYPTASGIATFQQELAPYESSKGAVRFPIDKPLPVDLISRMVKFRLQEDAEKAKLKKQK